jgi:hypothetical protein
MIPGHFYWDLNDHKEKPEEFELEYEEDTHWNGKTPSGANSNRNTNNPSNFMADGDSYAMHHLGPAKKPLFSLALKIPGNPNPPPVEHLNVDAKKQRKISIVDSDRKSTVL